MIKKTLFSIVALGALSTLSHATVVTLGTGFFGPNAFQSDGVTPVNGGLIRIGAVNEGADFGSGSVAEIDAVFREFGTANTSEVGGLGTSVTNTSAGSFDGQQIYVWVFDAPTSESAGDQALFTVADNSTPATPWTYPVNTGSGTDSVTIDLNEMINGNGLFIPAEAGPNAASQIVLAPIPEPSGVLLLGLVASLAVIRRRR